MIRPFVDPVTAKKVVFITAKDVETVMGSRFDMDVLEEPLGGRNKRVYNVDSKFQSQLCQACTRLERSAVPSRSVADKDDGAGGGDEV